MRFLIGGIAAVLAAVVVGVFALGGDGVSLANAADRMQGKDLRANVTMSMSVQGTDVTMKGHMLQSADFKRYLMDVKGNVAGTDMSQRVVVVDGDIWLTSPSFEPVMPAGKTWVKLGEDAMPDLGSMTFEELMAFCEAATDIEKRGEETVDGVRTTHYVGTVDLEAAAEKLGDKALLESGDAKMPLEIWLDANGNAVRMKMEMTVEGAKASFTMDGFEYDVDTSSIKAPPADEVVDGSELGIFDES